MDISDLFFKAVGINRKDKFAPRKLSQKTGVPVDKLKYYNITNTLPTGNDLNLICNKLGIKPGELMLKMGILDHRMISALRNNADTIYPLIKDELENENAPKSLYPKMLETSMGILYQGDCLDIMPNLESDSIDLIFADPPFNLDKLYPSNIDDNLKKDQYLEWCEKWIDQCVRILKPGGSLFSWNLPKWNTYISQFLNNRLTFRHWIAVDIKYRLPIRGRLYPSHYSLLYYCKGDKPTTFHPDRLPMEICPHCLGDLKDYGGYKNKMNPLGVNMTDVWFDIPPVRHAKYKKRNGSNELSIRLMDRIIEMSSDKGDLIIDPFGGSGTTYVVAELKNRRWIGMEIGPIDDIIKRFENIQNDEKHLKKTRHNYNCLFTDENLVKRTSTGLWTPNSVREEASN